MEIIFATGNADKAAEIQAMLQGVHQIKTLKDIGYLSEIPETGSTLEANAAIKAETIFEKYQIPVFSDDSGLEVSALNGEPGVLSARYAGPAATYNDNCIKLLSELRDKSDRSAIFRTVFCFIGTDGVKHFIEGNVNGKILTEMRGEMGFGYDPLFVPEGFEKTFAQMTPQEKNSCSHRAKAVKHLVEFLQSKGLAGAE